MSTLNRIIGSHNPQCTHNIIEKFKKVLREFRLMFQRYEKIFKPIDIILRAL